MVYLGLLRVERYFNNENFYPSYTFIGSVFAKSCQMPILVYEVIVLRSKQTLAAINYPKSQYRLRVSQWLQGAQS